MEWERPLGHQRKPDAAVSLVEPEALRYGRVMGPAAETIVGAQKIRLTDSGPDTDAVSPPAFREGRDLATRYHDSVDE